uniref:Uncharacterized protein n=1 Tax=Pararge aegeria TaxID=116150 RepID=S4NWF4_9NEOP
MRSDTGDRDCRVACAAFGNTLRCSCDPRSPARAAYYLYCTDYPLFRPLVIYSWIFRPRSYLYNAYII